MPLSASPAPKSPLEPATSPSIAFVNDYKHIYKVEDPNPIKMVTCVLNDLLRILNLHKGKGALMFQATRKMDCFLAIEKGAAVLRVTSGVHAL